MPSLVFLIWCCFFLFMLLGIIKNIKYIMTEKEKAIELVDFYEELTDGYNMFESYEQKIARDKAKLCAEKVCEEIINLETIHASGEQCFSHVKYWRQVKKEIELL